jgi:hypothetical protein
MKERERERERERDQKSYAYKRLLNWCSYLIENFSNIVRDKNAISKWDENLLKEILEVYEKNEGLFFL